MNHQEYCLIRTAKWINRRRQRVGGHWQGSCGWVNFWEALNGEHKIAIPRLHHGSTTPPPRLHHASTLTCPRIYPIQARSQPARWGGVWTWMGGTPGAPPPWTLSAWRHQFEKRPHSWTFTSTPPLGHCPCDVIHIFQGWNKIFGMGNGGGGSYDTPPPWLRACHPSTATWELGCHRLEGMHWNGFGWTD